jgi:hypothetical protein
MGRVFTQQQKVALKSCLQEGSNSLVRIEAERDNIKEIVTRMASEFELPRRLSRKLIRVYHKRNLEEEQAEQQELADTYETITK